MKTYLKIVACVAIATTLYSCEFFNSKDKKVSEENTRTENPDSSATRKDDSLNTATEGPAKDTGIVIKEEAKEVVKEEVKEKKN